MQCKINRIEYRLRLFTNALALRESDSFGMSIVTASIVGLTVRHEREHLIRAVLEGVAYGLKGSLMLIQNAGLDLITQVRASGDGTKSRL